MCMAVCRVRWSVRLASITTQNWSGVRISSSSRGLQRALLLVFLFVLLVARRNWQQDGVNVGQHATRCNGDAAQQLGQLVVVADGQLDVARGDASKGKRRA